MKKTNPIARALRALAQRLAPPDPWSVQRALMRASEQPMPAVPALTKGSLLYSALALEEVAETLHEGILPALARRHDRLYAMRQPAGAAPGAPRPEVRAEDPLLDQASRLQFVLARLRDEAERMSQTADAVRRALREVDDFTFQLTLQEARGALDGATDSVVVVCGLALSTGLPGAAGYEEVGASNLSKRNPSTGMIDKTPDGKWIKGEDFVPPDLGRVLLERAHVEGEPWPPRWRA